VASLGDRSLAGVADREYPHLRRKFGRYVHHLLTDRHELLRHGSLPMPAAPSTAQRRSWKRLLQRSSARKPFRSAGKVSCATSSLCSRRWPPRRSHALHVGVHPDEHPHAAPSCTIRPRSLLWRTEDIPTLGPCSSRGPRLCPKSPRSPFSTVGRRPRTSQPSLWAAGRWRATPTPAP